MNIAFLNPPWWEREPNGEPRRGIRAGSRWPMTISPSIRYTPFPFFLALAAGYAADHGHTVMLRDSIARRETIGECFQSLRAFRPALTVVEISTPSWTGDEKIIQGLLYWQLGRVMVVGPPLADPQVARKVLDCGVAAVAVGEYELAVTQAADLLEAEKELPRHFRAQLCEEWEINEFHPWREPAEAGLYWDAIDLCQDRQPVQVWASRGCPYRCTFCLWPQTMTLNRVRYYDSAWLREEITEGLAISGLGAVYFDDDTFNLSSSQVRKVCRVMADVGVPWAAMCRADQAEESTWSIMAAAGCTGVKLGVECASDRIREQMGKQLSLSSVTQAVRWCAAAGMRVHGTFILGWPGETKEELSATRNLIEHLYGLGMTSHQESGPAAHEGTVLWASGRRPRLFL